ncbi:MAG: hypothetical protein IKG87_03810 [Clostridia bacterium]|nr:hypothetical protein [Clostridia bacterium]
MNDREKVISELSEHIKSALFVDSDYVDCVQTELLQETVALLKEQEEQIKTRDESLEKAREEIKRLRGMLKEQEPVKVKDYADIVDGIQVGYCPKCDRKIVWNPEKEGTVAFCKYCGKAVKWE